MKKQLLLLAMILLPMVASADAVEIDGIYYNLITKGKIAEVTKKESDYGSPNYYSGNIVIPESVIYNGEEYIVTTICNDAFSSCEDLTSITIPNSVTSIGSYAFGYCTSLTSITIPNGVTTIEEWSFYNCNNLTSVTIPNSITNIESYAFAYCSSLHSFTIPNNLTTIKSYTFEYCYELSSITIPNSVTSIEKDAFKSCYNLTSVHISDVAAWCNISFRDNPFYNDGHVFLNNEEITNLIIPNNVTSISSRAFIYCSAITSVTIPNSVKSIGESAFAGCSGLTSLSIPNSVTSIAEGTFSGCSGLTSVTIPNNVTCIGEYAFSNCINLVTVTIPNSVTTIEGYAFSGCNSIKTVTLGSGIQSIYSKSFQDCKELTDVYCYAENVPEMLESVKINQGWYNLIACTDAFLNSYIEYATLHVPVSLVSSYQSSEAWGGFGSIVPLGNYYELSITSGTHGIVTYDNQSIIDNTIVFNVNEGSDLELTITPATGYQVSTLTVNGEDVKSQLTNGVLTISNVTANKTVEVTFELIPGYTESIKMSVPSGDRTAIGYSCSLGLDFTGIEDVKAWIVTGFTDDANVLLSRVRIVPPYTGLYLTSNVAGIEVDVPTTDKDIYYANLLKAAVEEETIQPTEMHDNVEFTNFVVGKLTSGEMGFVRVKTARTLGPNKSRLLVPSSYYPVANAAREFNVEFLDDDATTDIKGKEAVRQTANQLYDLQGRMISVSQARKGIYIYKGKKYVIK